MMKKMMRILAFVVVVVVVLKKRFIYLKSTLRRSRPKWPQWCGSVTAAMCVVSLSGAKCL